ncbi:hypothetical protein [Clostridium perfringens]|uniref:hypothetical protein n=1 Tax=Clostridium perfringens TaxID=1502 RepID=UPI002AC45A91|nr:hypothetical protein [Clostridium perfringens]MDZ5128567.1 hypothetical protein [Clostridium perfringens]
MLENNNEKIIDYKSGDVTGDGINDEVYIMSCAFNQCLNRHWLLIKEGNSERVVKYELEENNYNFEVHLEHFKDPNKLDIFIRSIGDCFGGCVKGQILTYENNELKEIFNTNDFYEKNKVSAFYRDDYKVEVLNYERNKKYIIDIKENFKYYLDFVYYGDGKVKEGKEKANISSVWGCNSYYPIGSEVANISIIQKVIGQASTDNICLIESKLRWKDNSFSIIDQTVILKGTSINQNNRSKEINNKKDFSIDTKNIYEDKYEDLVEYYNECVKFDSSSIYWYYLAKAQLLTKDLIGALKSINMNLSFQYPYPSKEKALILKENIEYSLRLNK